MKKIKALGIIALAMVVGFAMVSCPTDTNVGNPQSGNTGEAEVYVLDISQETEWDWLVVGTDGSSMVFNMDETTGMPTRLFLKPEKDSDDGFSYVFKENGLPDIMVNNGLVFVFDNFNGYTFDLAIMYPDDTIEYHFGIETDVDWDAYNAASVSGRSVGARSALDAVSVCLEVIGHGIGIITCATAFTNPASATGCFIYCGSVIAKSTIKVLDALGAFEVATASGNLTIDYINACIDALGCMGKDVKDCISLVTGLASMLIGDDLQVIADNILVIYEAKEELKPYPATVYFHPNGGSGMVFPRESWWTHPYPDSTVFLSNGDLLNVQTEEDNQITLPSATGLSRDGYRFICWGTSQNRGLLYQTGQNYTVTGNTTFYAQWSRLVPGAPEGVTATAESGSSITISWDPFPGALGYYVYGTSSTSSNFSLVATVLAPETSYTDTGLTPNMPYHYKVSYYNSIGESDQSEQVWLITPREDIGAGIGLPVEMVHVPGGAFQLGKSLGAGESGIGPGNDMTPVSNVTLSGFYIGKYEVTQSQWQAVMGSLPAETELTLEFYGKGDNFPLWGLSWFEALVFCNKLSIMEGLTPAYRIDNSANPDDWGDAPTSEYSTWNNVTIVSGSTGYRLPTEAQWEYAAKGGNPLAPGWVGYTYSGSDTLDNVAWYGFNRMGTACHAVGTKASNGLGLYDMSGNVSEWCWDQLWNYTSEDKTDPTGQDNAVMRRRVYRGGSCWSSSNYARSVNREYMEQYLGNGDTGIRLVRPQ